MSHFAWITPTHTLIHLDGIALGSLLALGMHTIPLSRRAWLWMGLGGILAGFSTAATVAGGTAFLDSALAVGFAGTVLALIASTGARNPMNAALRRGPLAFYGRISYGLYMFHIMVFVFLGWFDFRMDRYGMAGNLAIVALRWWPPPPLPQRFGTASSQRFSSSSATFEDSQCLYRGQRPTITKSARRKSATEGAADSWRRM